MPGRRVLAVAAALVALLAGAATAKSPSSGGAATPGTSTGKTHIRSTGAKDTPTSRTVHRVRKPATTTTVPAKATRRPKARKAKHKPRPIPKLTGSLSGGAVFPERTLVLSASPTLPLDTTRVHINENGGPISDLTVTPLAQAKAGDFGVAIMIDQSQGMDGAPLAQALAAARALGAQRTGRQEIGMITYYAQPTVILPLTNNPRAIARALRFTPYLAPGANILPALGSAYQQLAHAGIAAGAVILISNGSGQRLSPALANQIDSLSETPAATGVQLFTLALRAGQSNSGPLSQITKAAGGKFLPATGGQLEKLTTSIWTDLTRGYLVRYRSLQPRGGQVAVSVRADGIPSGLALSYVAARLPKAVTPLLHRHRKPHRRPVAQRQAAALPPAAPPSAAPLRATFWNSSTGVLAVAAACALLIGLAIAVLLGRQPSRAPHARVGKFIPGLSESEATLEKATGTRARLVQLASKRRWWPAFVEQVQAGRIQRSPQDLVRLTGALAMIAALVVIVLAGSPALGILVLLLAPVLMRAYVSRAAGRQRTRFADQLPSHLLDLSGAMRAGRSFVGGIAAVAETSVEPIKGELERALTDEQLGSPLEETLEAIGRRMQSDDMGQVALVAALHRSSGSNVSEALDRVAEGARERGDMRRQFAALTAQARLSSRVLAGLPLALLVGLHFVDPSYDKPLFQTLAGNVTLGLCTVMVIAGWYVMKKIANVEV